MTIIIFFSRTHLLGPLQGIFSSKSVIRCNLFFTIYMKGNTLKTNSSISSCDFCNIKTNETILWTLTSSEKSADWQELLDSLFNEDGNYTGLPRPSYPRPPTTATTARPPTTATTATTTKAGTTASHTGGTDHAGETTTMQVLIFKIFNLLF